MVKWMILIVVLSVLSFPVVHAAVVPVSDFYQLFSAVENAEPGDTITLAPGTYTSNDWNWGVPAAADGTAANPITVRAETLGDAILQLTEQTNGAIYFSVTGKHWVFENLVIEGICSYDSACEHAFHVTGDADNLIIRNSIMRDFNAQIKGNGNGAPVSSRLFANDVIIENNEFYNTAERDTGNPVNAWDVVGGQRWMFRGNLIQDIGSRWRDAPAGYPKGNAKDPIMENNLVFCERYVPASQPRIGLSFGDGGSFGDICEDGVCSPETRGGIIRNNIILNCNDVGIYMNNAQDAKVYNNILYNTGGIDVRFSDSTADIRNNILSGYINERDGGTAISSSNLEGVTNTQWDVWFANPAGADFSLLDGSQIVDQGVNLPEVTTDYCGRQRSDGHIDLGPVEYSADPCDTTQPGGTNQPNCHWADSDCGGTVGISELVVVITSWMSGERSISELVEVIQLWQNG